MEFCYSKSLLYFALAFILTLFCSCDNDNLSRSKNIYTLLTAKNDSLTVADILTPEIRNQFKKSKTYKKTNDSILWCFLTIKKEDLSNKTNFLVSSDPFLTSGKAYIIRNDKQEVTQLHTFTHNKKNAFNFVFYRNAVWELPNTINIGDKILLKLEGHKLRNRIDFFIHDLNSFLKIVELEYFWLGTLATFLIVLCILLLIYAILIKEFSILYYVLYVVFLVLDFYSSKGFGKQFLWSSNEFLMQNRSYSFLLASTFLSFFFTYFYPYDTRNIVYKNIFKYLGIASLVAVIGSILNYYVAIHDNYTGITFYGLQFIALIYLIIHILLAVNKQIPKYLAFGFSIPFIALISYQLSIPYINTGSSLIKRFLFLNLPYIAFTIEIMIMSYYIFDKMVKVQRRYFKLKRINNSLTKNMNSMTLEAELNERNKLLSNIHDSFGGSIEALKYSLKIDNSSINVEKAIDSFYSQYRLLLRNLDNPEINSNNLENYMNTYLEELEHIFPIYFISYITVDNLFIHKEKCTHVYLSFCELITNAIKHSKATKVKVNFFSSKNELILEILDDGVGFSETKKRGYGLKSIEERTTKFNGTLKITSNDLGSCVILKLPLQQHG